MKRGRAEREAVREEIEMMRREQESQQFQEWAKQEDQFHLKQAKERSRIRIREARAKAIDLLGRYAPTTGLLWSESRPGEHSEKEHRSRVLLFRYINAEENEDDMDIEMQEPYHYLNGLGVRDLEDLLEDIRVYQSLEGDQNADYWKDIRIIADDELSKLKKLDPSSAEYVGLRREGIHRSVRKDVSNIVKGILLGWCLTFAFGVCFRPGHICQFGNDLIPTICVFFLGWSVWSNLNH